MNGGVDFLELVTKKRLYQRIATIILVGTSVVLTLLTAFLNSGLALITAGGLMIIWIAFSVFNCRCPACGKTLPIWGDTLECPKCHVSLTANRVKSTMGLPKM